MDIQKPESRPTPKISLANEIRRRAKDGRLSCKAAFEIVAASGVSAGRVGEAMDAANTRITRCQLGLFGYQPEKKIVKPQAQIKPELKDAIFENLVGEKLSCKSCWEIAERLNVGRMDVSGACEALKVKIKPCQLGAF